MATPPTTLFGGVKAPARGLIFRLFSVCFYGILFLEKMSLSAFTLMHQSNCYPLCFVDIILDHDEVFLLTSL